MRMPHSYRVSEHGSPEKPRSDGDHSDAALSVYEPSGEERRTTASSRRLENGAAHAGRYACEA